MRIKLRNQEQKMKFKNEKRKMNYITNENRSIKEEQMKNETPKIINKKLETKNKNLK